MGLASDPVFRVYDHLDCGVSALSAAAGAIHPASIFRDRRKTPVNTAGVQKKLQAAPRYLLTWVVLDFIYICVISVFLENKIHLPSVNFFVAHFSGIAIGTMVMFTGIGGGVLWIPVLTILGIKPAEAVAISIFTQIAGKGVGSINYLRAGMVDLDVAAVFVPVAFVGALIGFISGFMISARYEKLLLYIFLLVATYLLVKMILSLSEDQSEPQAIYDAKAMKKSYPVVLFSSFFTGLLSIGNSDWLIPYMQRKLKLSTSHSVATGIFVMFATSVFFLLMTVVSVWFGLQSWPDGAPVLFATCSGVMMGGQIGTRLVRYQWLKDRQKHAFILLLAMSIIHLLW